MTSSDRVGVGRASRRRSSRSCRAATRRGRPGRAAATTRRRARRPSRAHPAACERRRSPSARRTRRCRRVGAPVDATTSPLVRLPRTRGCTRPDALGSRRSAPDRAPVRSRGCAAVELGERARVRTVPADRTASTISSAASAPPSSQSPLPVDLRRSRSSPVVLTSGVAMTCVDAPAHPVSSERERMPGRAASARACGATRSVTAEVGDARALRRAASRVSRRRATRRRRWTRGARRSRCRSRTCRSRRAPRPRWPCTSWVRSVDLAVAVHRVERVRRVGSAPVRCTLPPSTEMSSAADRAPSRRSGPR